MLGKIDLPNKAFYIVMVLGKWRIAYMLADKVLRPRQEQKRVNVDFPTWMIQQLDKEARKLGVTRQSIIKFWLAERLKEST